MTIWTMVMWVLLPVLVTVSVAVAPWVTDRREVFGVTVPPSAFADERILGLRRNYAASVGCLGGMFVLASLGVWRGFGLTAALWVVSLASVLITVIGFVRLQRCRREVLAIKAERGWRADAGSRCIAVIDGSLPKPLSPWWDLVYVAIIAATVAVGYLGYDGMPQRVPMHTDMAGVVDGWADKSPLVIWFAPAYELVLAIVMTIAHIAILNAKRPIDPRRPMDSAWGYAVMMRAWSVYTLIVGVVVTLGIGMAVQLGVLGLVPLGAVGLIGMLVAVLALVGCLVVALFYGQNGSRLVERDGSAAGEMDGSDADDDAMSYDDDRYWCWGVLYVNRDDPAVWVPKRFGVGWTVNLARPSVWVGIVALIVLSVAGITLPLM
ncbi:DUF1648 domain-containing protein [Bifidobacterium sp. MA2]|uniref:DUF1648 domain-containing protein n=1 Tax=Bifidobacterium santillanense TaxID=2809028 RepID=A0ABS5UPX5_9BIFI|nr:DUF5808 domain-containing protein [Bifidobacterium santillanense]MBT1172940.1 DUF1648 domain-containing protein [Bifidobacterium santillanense]